MLPPPSSLVFAYKNYKLTRNYLNWDNSCLRDLCTLSPGRACCPTSPDRIAGRGRLTCKATERVDENDKVGLVPF